MIETPLTIRLYNARICTMKEPLCIEHGEIWIKDDQIVYVGQPSSEELAKITFITEMNCEENLLLPGFKNAHTHSPMTFLRSNADDMPLQEWLFNHVFGYEAKLTPEDSGLFSKLAILEYLSSGITSNFDMYFHVEEIAKASVSMGFRTVICTAGTDNILERTAREFEMFNQYHPLITARLGFHAEYTTSLENLTLIASLAKKYKTPVYTHNSETKKEVVECIERYHVTPTKLFDQLGMFEYGGGGFHGVYLDDDDIKIFKEKGLHIVTNSGSNVKLASGIAPIQKFMDNKINIALGTDGAASNNCLDMFREMFLTTALQKVSLLDPSLIPALDVLKMATVNGAHAMGLTDCDVLEVSKQADIILIDLNQPNMRPQNNILKNLVFSGSKQNIKMTMVAGKILYENGRYHVGENVNEIYEKVQKRTEEILK